jgi:hypothetical protein
LLVKLCVIIQKPSKTTGTKMDQTTRDNWKKVKETMEASGKTDNMYYKRACQIVNGGSDPLDKLLKDD